MDIAEIRKKAKSVKSPAPEPEKTPLDESTVMDNPAPPESELSDTVHPEQEDTAVSPTPGPATEAPSRSNAFEKLFAEEGTFELATEEAYQDALAAQGEIEDQLVHQYLAFQLGKEEYALDITRISEIIKVREFTEIPRVPEFILGIISLRGVVVPIFDLKKRFQLGVANITSASRVIVCQSGEVAAGLLVDSINQVITLADDRLEPPPAVLSGIDRDLVDGVGRYQGRMIIVLNLECVLDVEMT